MCTGDDSIFVISSSNVMSMFCVIAVCVVSMCSMKTLCSRLMLISCVFILVASSYLPCRLAYLNFCWRVSRAILSDNSCIFWPEGLKWVSCWLAVPRLF